MEFKKMIDDLGGDVFHWRTKDALHAVGITGPTWHDWLYSGLVVPSTPGVRGKSSVFSVQDLVVMATAKALLLVGVARPVVKTALAAIRDQWPALADGGARYLVLGFCDGQEPIRLSSKADLPAGCDAVVVVDLHFLGEQMVRRLNARLDDAVKKASASFEILEKLSKSPADSAATKAMALSKMVDRIIKHGGVAR